MGGAETAEDDDSRPAAEPWFAPLCRALDLVRLQAEQRRKTDQTMPWDRPPGGRNRTMYCGDRSQRTDDRETEGP